MSRRIITHGLSGLGPRNAQYLVNLALVLLSNKDNLDTISNSHGIEFVFHYDVFEKHEVAGSGNAFQMECDAAVNTSVTGLPDILGVDNVDPEFKAYADLASTVSAALNAGSTNFITRLEQRNPAAAVLFTKALLPDGQVNTALACMTRGEWGRLQFENITNALAYIRDNMSDILVINVHYLHEVIAAVFDNPRKPGIVVRKVGEIATAVHQFDFVTFAHGTPLVSPVSAEVAKKSYSLTPNHDTMRDYLNDCGVLDTQGYIIPGKSIAFTGLSLSFYDYASLLLPFLPCFHRSDTNPTGYEIDPAGASPYQGLISVISRSARGPTPPRLAPDQKWRGAAKPILSTEEMHVLRLQRKENWMEGAYAALEASVARSTGKVPSEVHSSTTIAEYMAAYHAENEQYLAGIQGTETDLLRAGFVAFSTGAGLEVDPAAVEAALVQKAPLSRKGRVGWPMFSASGVEMSKHAMIDTPKNAEFFKHWDQLHHFISASPVPIQQAMALLFESGIATHLTGTFDKICVLNDKVSLFGREFDALLAPKVIRRESDPVLASTNGKVKEIFPGVPDYGKGMYFQTTDGDPINAFDCGMGGWGIKFRNTDDEPRTAGEQWNETNNHGAAGTFGTHHALHTLMLSVALVVEPEASPIDTVSGFYLQTQPEAAAFKAEVARFGPIWKEVQEKLLFLGLCEELAGNASALYRAYTDEIFTATARDRFIGMLPPLDQDKYAAKLNSLKTYDPPTLAQFERRFIGYTKPQLDGMIAHMFGVIANSESAMEEDEED